jgi:Spy/CpxP family protein refolding chaperone
MVMKTLWATLMLAAALAAGPRLCADDKGPGERKAAGANLAEQIQDLNLTDDQEAKIADIRKEYRPKVEEAAKDLAALVKGEVEKARGVLTDDQKTKLAAMKDEREDLREERLAERIAHLEQLDLTDDETAKIAAIRKEYQPQIVKALESLKGALTDDQRKAREEALAAGKKRKEVIAALNLTGDQKEKIEAVGKELRTLVREELEKMRDVLSDGQQSKLEEFKAERREHVRDRKANAIMNFKDLNLTDDQKSQIVNIRMEYRPKVHEAGNKLRAAVREEVDAILAVVKA